MQTHLLISIMTRTLLALSITMLFSNTAIANHKHRHHTHNVYYEQIRYSDDGYGRVLHASPIYQNIAVEVPEESCHVETIAHEGRRRNGDSFGGTVVGGLVGAAIGHELGDGRGGATAVGGLIGAAIGKDASRSARVVAYRDQEVCRTHYRTEYKNRIVGYDVTYRYQGRIYQTRTNRHPGDRVPVAAHYPSYRD